jgi:hypothetical protein
VVTLCDAVRVHGGGRGGRRVDDPPPLSTFGGPRLLFAGRLGIITCNRRTLATSRLQFPRHDAAADACETHRDNHCALAKCCLAACKPPSVGVKQRDNRVLISVDLSLTSSLTTGQAVFNTLAFCSLLDYTTLHYWIFHLGNFHLI